MTASDILAFWQTAVPAGWEGTCDGLWYDVPGKEIQRILVCFKVTSSVLDEAEGWAADMLITHEPMWPHYDGEMHDTETDPAILAMDRRLRENALPVLRLHDHAHLFPGDFIHMGFLAALGLEIADRREPYQLGIRQYILKTPLTTRRIARLSKELYGVEHPRLTGAIDTPITRMTLALGGTGNLGYHYLVSTDTELFVTGEVNELGTAFGTQELAAMGQTKALLLLGGHCEAERYGMAVLADWMAKELPALELRFAHNADSYVVL